MTFTHLIQTEKNIMKVKFNYSILLLALSIYNSTLGQGTIERCRVLYEEKKYADAEKVLNAIASNNTSYAAAQYYLGRIAFDKKDYEKAVEFFETATKVNLKNAEYFFYYGIASAEMAKAASIFSKPSWASQSRKAWETASALDSRYIEPRLSLIDYYSMVPGVMGGSMDKAKEMANEVMNLNEAEGHWRLGSLLVTENNTIKAEEEFAKMIKANPTYAGNLGSYYSDQKKYPKAIELFEQALSINPNDFLSLYRYGRASAISGAKLERGEECLKRYLTYEPKYGEPSLAGAYMRLGQVLEKKGNKSEARKNYETAVKLDDSLKEAKEGLIRTK